jgi:hypothetical protein|uniref:Calcineurin-like phosphoesterase domain-containing protein n=1 Tax=viral metagenome TaxID=1070528 RepID=A0A6C0BKZ3_9ZZZZ
MPQDLSFQYFSDLHLEFYPILVNFDSFQITPCAPYLLLAGDLGNIFDSTYEEFLRYVSELYRYVFITTGNHEYYRRAQVSPARLESLEWMQCVDHHLREITSRLPNVVYLQDQMFIIPRTQVAVYGTTLWSRIASYETRDIIHNINDYHQIPRFTPSLSNQLFEHKSDTLRQALSDHPELIFVVMTHHLPSYQLIDSRYLDYPYNSEFASSLTWSDDPQIAAWVSGHTHTPCESGKYHVNPVGYPNENPSFDCNRVFHIQASSDQ